MKKLAAATILALSLAVSLIWFLGGLLSKPANHQVAMPTAGFEPVVIGTTRGSILKADSNARCALLLHGVRADRSSMIPRARYLHSIGFTALLVDLQAHGETPGDMITFGYRESNDAAQGLGYLRDSLSCRKIVAIGQSLGGASLLLGNHPVQADAVVLESVYPGIEKAVANRLAIRLGAIGALAAPLLYLQIPLRADISLADLQPLEAARHLRVPVLIVGGSADQHTTAADSTLIYEAVPPGNKHFWLVEGAAHQDLFLFNPEHYKRRFEEFIELIL